MKQILHLLKEKKITPQFAVIIAISCSYHAVFYTYWNNLPLSRLKFNCYCCCYYYYLFFIWCVFYTCWKDKKIRSRPKFSSSPSATQTFDWSRHVCEKPGTAFHAAFDCFCMHDYSRVLSLSTPQGFCMGKSIEFVGGLISIDWSTLLSRKF